MPTLRLGHSPDPDDAFMWWPLATLDGKPSRIPTGDFDVELVAADIEFLNQRSEKGELDITAMSCAQYARVKTLYALTACGASVGDGYGPKLVARRELTHDELRHPSSTIAIPGERTTAFLTLNLLLGPGTFRHVVMPFEKIIDAVADERVTAGLVIHEGQLTFGERDLRLLVDMGAWWRERTGLPLPLGANAVRRDLDQRFGKGSTQAVAAMLEQSVRYALDNREESIAYAMNFARGIPAGTTDRFVQLYVNHWTLDYGPIGEAAVRRLLRDASAAGLTPDPGEIEFVRSASK